MLSVEVAAGMIGAAFVVGFAIGFALRSYISNRRRERARARRFGSTWSPPLSFQMDGDEREKEAASVSDCLTGPHRTSQRVINGRE
jgi:hypothetical protein